MRFGTKLIIGLCTAAILTACGTPPPPKRVHSACAIFDQHRAWYRHMSRAEKRWGMPIHIQLAIMRQESGFVGDARPPRKKFLFVLPGKRLSSAYGYAQVKNGTWDWYRKSTGKRGADRDDFKDAADFISWYGSKSRDIAGISLWDPYNQYLAYHEGHGGFQRGSYNKKKWLMNVAAQVDQNAKNYGAQLKTCEKRFKRRFLFI